MMVNGVRIRWIRIRHNAWDDVDLYKGIK